MVNIRFIKPIDKTTQARLVRRAENTRASQAIDGGTVNFNVLNDILYKGREDRLNRLRVYESMDMDTDVHRALDMIAEHCTQKNAHTRLPFKFEFGDDELSGIDTDILNSMLKHWVKVNDWDNRLFRTVRNVLKYGDAFFIRDPNTFKLRAVPAKKVLGIYVDPTSMEIEGYHFKDLDFLYDFMIPATQTSTPSISSLGAINSYDGGSPAQSVKFDAIVPATYVVHISLSEGKDSGGNGSTDDIWPFGESFLEQAYKTFRQRDLLENAVLIHRVQRAPSRRVWYIDVGKMRPDKARSAIERFKNELLTKRMPTKFGGAEHMDSIYNPISQMEDIYLPQTADGRGSKVDNLEGQQWNGLEDLQYFTGKMLRGMKVPVSFMLGPEEGGATFNDGRLGTAYIQEQDFAKFCERVQDIIDNEFDFEFKLYVKTRGIQINSSHYDLKFELPMNFDEYREGDLNDARLNRLSTATNMPFMSKQFALKKYGGFSKDEIMENERLWIEENMPKTAQEQTQNAGGFGGSPMLGGGLGGIGGIDSMPPPDTGGMGQFGQGGEASPGMGGAPGGMDGAPGGMGGAPATQSTGFESRSNSVDGQVIMEDKDEVKIPPKKKDLSKEAVADDKLLFTTDSDGNRVHMTLKHLKKLRIEKEKRRIELLKRLELIHKVYAAPSSGF